MLGAGVSPDPRATQRVPPNSLALPCDCKGGSSKQRTSGDAAVATAGGDRAAMAGMYEHQLLDDPFTLGSHCNDQPQHPSTPAHASPSPQADDGGERRLLLQALFGEILLCGARRGGGIGEGEGEASRDLEEVMQWVQELAADPVAARPPSGEDAARERQVLAVRRARYLRIEDVADAEELPSFPRKRKHGAHNNNQLERQKKKGSLNAPTRKSERLAKRMKLMTSLLLTQRKKIGTGEQFQAEIPEWTGTPSEQEISNYRNDPNISKMVGIRIWPPEGGVLQVGSVIAGQGKPESCSCMCPGSFFCRQHHISLARDQLRSELGQAFSAWGFDSMGEEVSKTWSHEEQLRFSALEQLFPVLDHKTFWGVALKHFSSKSRADLLQYYLNVFLMRRVANQCRLNLLEIDSDEDEVEEEED